MRPACCGSPASRVIWLASAVLLLTTCFPHAALGCFPTEDVFKKSCLWIQPISMMSRWRISLCSESGQSGAEGRVPMKLEFEGVGDRAIWKDTTLDCLESYEGHRYMVRVRDSGGKTQGYQCYKFSPLSESIVRQAKGPLLSSKDQLNCQDTSYNVDEAVLISSLFKPEPRPCPLSGGFQMRMRLGEDMSSTQRCLDSVHTYRPQLQFQCDHLGSSGALADLGRSCTPRVLWESQKLRGRYVAHLDCLDSWQEKPGTPGEFTSVLMLMRDASDTYWCLHFKKKMSFEAGEELYEAFLTFDGRCMQEFSGGRDVPRDTSMFGHLVTFLPANDTRCYEKSYLEGCQGYPDQKCAQSLDCPHGCGRCEEELELKRCSFPGEMEGAWGKFGDPDDKPWLEVGGNTVHSPSFGEFRCRAPMEFGSVKGLYPLMQTGATSTCMPYYSCAQILSLAPGLLSFQKRPALRDRSTGSLYSCQETHAEVWSIRPEKAEETVTLMNRDKLRAVPCQLKESQAYPTVALGAGCHVVIGECSGSCEAFNVSLATCNNMSAADAGFLIQHECVARVSFKDGTRAILTRVPGTKDFLCWVVTKSGLLLLRADKCNQEGIDEVFKFEEKPYARYDPTYKLIKSVRKTQSGDEGHLMVASVSLVGLSAFCSWLVLTRV